MSDANVCTARLSEPIRFESPDWSAVPDRPGVYVISDMDEVIYVGMAGRNGRGNLRRRLQDHASGQIVNMFAQYLFLARVQFVSEQRIIHPRNAKSACRDYITARCSFRYHATTSGGEARDLEKQLKAELRPAFNP